MKRYQSNQQNLALGLALALGLGVMGAAAAAPADQGTSPQSFGGLDLKQVPAEVLAPFADLLAAQTQERQAVTGTITVTSCANSGSGSLRSAVAAASSGDTIDLSHLSCSTINLTGGEIPITQHSLTIKSKAGERPWYTPSPKIDAMHSGRVFNHTGTGILYLNHLAIWNGFIDHIVTGDSDNFGGCVYSAGQVRVTGTHMAFCSAEAPGNASGGAVYAANGINLGKYNDFYGNKVKGVWYAMGGSLYTGHGIVLTGETHVRASSATVESRGFARGGGIYANVMLGGDLVLKDNTVQETSGADAQAVQGGGAYVFDGMLVSKLTVTGNAALGPSSSGGGLYVKKVVQIENNSTIKSNSADGDGADGDGGGIYAVDKLTLTASTVADNTAQRGGGIFALDALILEESSVTGNDGEINSGGIRADGNVTIKGSTIADNTSDHVAGLRLGANATNPIIIDQSTISGNLAGDSSWGSGLYLLHDAVIKNSTITENDTNPSNGTAYGAGISLGGGVQLTLYSTIVSWNAHLNNVGTRTLDDIGKASGAGTVYDILGSHNAISSSTVTTPADTISGYPGLNDLADNGGPTLTHMPKSNSVAIDNGIDNGFSCDQRGDGFARVAGITADIGAVEVQDDEVTDRIFADGFDPAASTSCN